MAHKFRGVWRSYVFINNAWHYQGEMDLSTMDDNGHIEDGHHPVPNLRLRGDAFVNTALRLKTVPQGITYVGVLTHDVGGQMTITGAEIFGVTEAEARASFLEATRGEIDLQQDDPPWVITKP